MILGKCRRYLKFKAFSASLLFIFYFSSPAWAKVEVKGFRHWVDPDKTRLVLDLSSPSDFKQSKVEQDKTLLVEIPDGENQTGASSYLIQKSPVKGVRFHQKSDGSLGVVVEMGMPLKSEVFTLKKYLHKSDRLVIDVFHQDSNERWRKQVEEVQEIKQKGKKIVVLDPGHGGEDPGAIGRRYRYREKDIALSIARKCQELLKKEARINPVMTRTGDYYVSLGRRVRIARDYDADLFVSIHVNSSPNRRRKGSSIYYLSPKGASDKATRLLALQENAADLLGGVPMSKEDQTLNAILISMSQTSTINDSILFGDTIVNQFARSVRQVRIDRELRSAPFAVLKSPQIPSILFETAFISNSTEEKLLGTSLFQWDLAKTVVQAIKKYFGDLNEESPVPLKMVQLPQKTKEQPRSVKTRVHIVEKGDTVYNISRRYGITISRLKSMNHIGRSNRILVGQKLKIPPVDQSQAL